VSDDLPREVSQARIKLMLDEPYLASAVARFPLVNAEKMDWCETMAVDGYYIYVNPEFCRNLSTPEIAFVLAHEVMHCVLGHIDRRGHRDADLWNQAADYATNLMLVQMGLTMPKEGLINASFKGMTAEQIYELLKEKTSKGSGDGDSKGNASPGGGGKGWDLHIGPDDMRGQSTRAQDFPTAEERKRLRVSITKSLEPKLRGLAPGMFESEIRQAQGGQVPWRTLLSRFFTGLRRDNYRLMPPNKKHVWRGIYLPSMGAPGPSHIVVAIDTSGSMTDDILADVIGEIDKLRSTTECRLTLIQCDAAIHKVEEFDEYSGTSFARFRVFGRGGTSFKPVFNWIRDQSQRGVYQFDTLIYLTDGYGDFPEKSPTYPVLWIMTKNGKGEAPFGEVIKMAA
jgi:predicted metal-dependent peptidase